MRSAFPASSCVFGHPTHVPMGDDTETWAYRPRHGARIRRGTVLWAVAAVLRLVVLMALLLAALAGLTAAVGFVLVRQLAGLLTGR